MNKFFFNKIVRSLFRNKGYGVLNLFGLALGIACTLFIFLWIEDELTYNHEFKNRDRLYEVMQTMKGPSMTSVFPMSPPVLGETIQGEIPEVTNVVRLKSNISTISVGDRQFSESGYYCDPSFFPMFDVKFIHGNPESAFRDVSSIVLSEQAAEKFFPGENPIGKTVQIDNKALYTVTATVKKFPDNVSLGFEWLIPIEVFLSANEWAMFGWTANSLETIIELHPAADAKTVEKKLLDLLIAKRGNDMIGAFLFNMNDWRLYSDFDDQGKPVGEKVKSIRLFTLIAFIILVLACINFMNLATASAMKRAKEVGVLKAVGVRRPVLIRRFLGESMIQTSMAVCLSILMVVSVMPVYNQLVAKNLSFYLFTPAHIIALLAILLFCGLLSGAYPAFFLSSFNAVDVLKGLKLPGNKGTTNMRKTLVVFQFSVSACLIICILTIYTQFRYTFNLDRGYSSDRIVTVPMTEEMFTHSSVLLQEARRLSSIESAAVASNITMIGYWGSTDWRGKDATMENITYAASCKSGILSMMGVEMVEGRELYEHPESEEQRTAVINVQLAQLMGEEGRVGGEITFNGTIYRITGIFKDYIFYQNNNLVNKPLLLTAHHNMHYSAYYLYLKLNHGMNISSVMQSVETLLKPYLADKPFNYSILKDREDWMMRSGVLANWVFISKLLLCFSVIAVLVSCFGLLGLTAFAAEQRTREIGIRKVFGASVSQVMLLLSKDFFRLVGIACIIAFPVAFWVMSRWLDNFEYRIGLSWWMFAVGGVLTFVIALAAVGVQTLKAATINPVNAIKRE